VKVTHGGTSVVLEFDTLVARKTYKPRYPGELERKVKPVFIAEARKHG
jgi:hypothetical protein